MWDTCHRIFDDTGDSYVSVNYCCTAYKMSGHRHLSRYTPVPYKWSIEPALFLNFPTLSQEKAQNSWLSPPPLQTYFQGHCPPRSKSRRYQTCYPPRSHSPACSPPRSHSRPAPPYFLSPPPPSHILVHSPCLRRRRWLKPDLKNWTAFDRWLPYLITQSPPAWHLKWSFEHPSMRGGR